VSVESSKIIDGLAYEITSHEFKVRVDVSEKLGGKNSAPNPHDYLEIALAGCTAITVQMYANRKGIPLQYSDVKITITAEGAKNEILREIKFVGDLTEEQKQNLLRIAEKCPLHNLISAGAKIETRIV
jgi:putative redox protein